MRKITNKDEYIIGIDEAGRGPVIGPMVICAVAIRKDLEKKLTSMGVRDSKILSKKKRESLYPQIYNLAEDIQVKHLSAAEIDEMRKSSSLNRIEQVIMVNQAKKIKVKPKEIYIDAADVNEKRFGGAFEIEFPTAKIISKHQADKYYPVVSAASVIAKVERDKAIDKISKELGSDIGSGYPADPKTKDFLKKYYSKHKKFPKYVRESWDTTKKIKDELAQTRKISDYFS